MAIKDLKQTFPSQSILKEGKLAKPL